MVLFRTAGVQDMYTVESPRFNAQCNANPKESSNIEHPEDFESAQQLPVFVWSSFPIVDTDFTAELQMRPGVLEDFANPLSIASKMFFTTILLDRDISAYIPWQWLSQAGPKARN